ncbi:chromate efflux transporter [Nitratidesulfovibrio vulgaris]|nr:chromate efflux transporter [Nitratidesulfovibrio vulgaris]ADP88328.1 chromate transporter, chromate ion transporter (CHR) family [Nitratidesulfovibrio vulgaris RCH1]
MMDARQVPSFSEAFRTWLRIGLLGFGGPAGQIALMHKTLVEEKKWVDNERFLHALNYCHFLPGPEAQQLATYVGWLLHRTWGGIVAGTLFILPGYCVIMALSILYAGYRQVPAVEALFYGLKPAVLAIVIGAVLRMGRKSLRTPFAVCLAGMAFMALFAFRVPFPWVIGCAALLGWLKAGRDRAAAPAGAAGAAVPGDAEPLPDHVHPDTGRSLRTLAMWSALWFIPVAASGWLAGWDSVYAHIALFFSKMAVVTFGGAYAVLTYVAQQAVENYQWLSPGDMISGLALAETTPGPLILVLQYVGFMAAYAAPGALHPVVAGVLGGTLAVWVTFTPCFLWIFLGAPYMEKVRANKALSAAFAGVTAAVVGVILNLSAWFGLHTLFTRVQDWDGPVGLLLPVPVLASFDAGAFALSAVAVFAMTRFRLGMGVTLGLCALSGWAMKLLL